MKPTEITVGSHKKILWKCKLGHEWEAAVKSRTLNGTGCPYCSHNSILEGFNVLASQFPDVVDDVLCKFVSAKKKKVTIQYI